jgi:hypothetical protein
MSASANGAESRAAAIGGDVSDAKDKGR